MATSNAEHLHHQQPSPSQTLPSISSLTNGLSNPNQYSPQNRQPSHLPSRDSGTWPHPQMKPVESSINNPSLQVSTLLNPDDSQSRHSIPNTPTSARLSQHQQYPSTTLPSINQAFDSGNRVSVDYNQSLESRRSSIDSRVNTGFSNLGLNNPTSPYESQNGSQVSLAASLRRPNHGNPMSPLGSSRNSIRSSHGPRVAPPIVGASRVPGAPDPLAARPTPGHPWAFPDDPIAEEPRRESSSEDSQRHSISRTNSYAASSLRSSVFSNGEGLPYGQRRFDDDIPTHHHSMQQHRISAIQNEANGSGGGNYSRTPELRISHKLAERKRRSEMKDLFEELNRSVPSGGGAKASKWEILTKAIEHIKNNQNTEARLGNEINRLRDASDYARDAHQQIEALHTEIAVMHERLRRMDPANPHVYGVYTSKLSQAQANGAPTQTFLPAMNAGPPSHQAYGAPAAPSQGMQGVEYGGPSRLQH